MSNFKIGDKVKLNIDDTYYNYIKEGVEYVIKEIHQEQDVDESMTLFPSLGIQLTYKYPTKEFVLVEEKPEFDITADISQQYTRNGQKVDYIINTKLDIESPVIFHVENTGYLTSATNKGKVINSNLDIITRPVLLPSKIVYEETYLDSEGKLHVGGYTEIAKLYQSQEDFPSFKTLMTERIEYNPNTNEITRTEIKPK